MTTDTHPLAPTDIDIDALWVGQQLTVPQLVQRRVIARAVLAKWGVQPVPAGYALVPVELTLEMLSVMWVPANSSLADAYSSLSDAYNAMLAAAPQPVVREPLTDEAVDLLCKVGPVYVLDGKVTRTPAQYRDELKAAQRYGLRQGERAHGIKGGQHGTE